jgi:hypothetical protein
MSFVLRLQKTHRLGMIEVQSPFRMYERLPTIHIVWWSRRQIHVWLAMLEGCSYSRKFLIIGVIVRPVSVLGLSTHL